MFFSLNACLASIILSISFSYELIPGMDNIYSFNFGTFFNINDKRFEYSNKALLVNIEYILFLLTFRLFIWSLINRKNNLYWRITLNLSYPQ